jgi:hypothetical protein
MSNQIIIPNNNLPVCIQSYDLTFLNNTGSISWATSCANPSNTAFMRVWNLNFSGTINKSSLEHTLVGDFSKVKLKWFGCDLLPALTDSFTE